MRTERRLRQLAVLALIIGGSIVGQGSAFGGEPGPAQGDELSIVDARQRVQAELNAAVADGRLSRMEQYDILLLARDTLSRPDLLILQRTMDRLSEKYDAPSRTLREELAQRIGREVKSDDQTVSARPTRAGSIDDKNTGATETVSYEQPAKSLGDGDATTTEKENPFKEELLPTPASDEAGTEVYFDDPEMTFENYGPFYGSQFGILAHPFVLAQCLPVDVQFSTALESFKGPMDLDNQNGNFGISFGINAGVVVLKDWGIGIQGGVKDILSNFHGSRLTGEKIRSQSFTTVGMFQRVPLGEGKMKWGFAYDWLHDDYFDSIRLGQWRVKLAYDFDCSNEIGLWANIPTRNDTAWLGRQTGFNRFESVAQGNFYLRHFWENGAETTHWIGMAEQPGGFVIGSSGRIPMTTHLSLIADFNYITPSDGRDGHQDQEMWQMALGIEITPGCRMLGCRDRASTPLLPVANNAAFAVRRTQ